MTPMVFRATASPRHDRRAFALGEVMATVAVLLVVLAVVAVLIPDTRRRSQMAGSLTNLQRLGVGGADYALANADSVFSFTWRAGPSRMCDDGFFFGPSASDQQAAADQAVCILRRFDQRSDIQAITGWIPHVLYSHLPLMEFMDESLPSRLTVSPGDRLRLEWQNAIDRDPADPNTPFFALRCRPGAPSQSNSDKRWPYSSSYELAPAFFSPDATTPEGSTVYQGGTHNTYTIGAGVPMGRRLLSEVRFPSQKAMLYESNQRFFGHRDLFFMYEEARVPVLLSDGSAAVRVTEHCNRGFQPNAPTSALPTQLTYQPDASWETPTPSGQATQVVTAHMRFTRSGLRGRDFGGPEVPWVP